MKHIKLFETEAEYNSATLELPNVSYVEETKIVAYKSNKPEVIEYHFDIPMEEKDDPNGFGFRILDGSINGDFSEFHKKLYDCADKYGNKLVDDYWIITEDIIDDYLNVTVNGDKAYELNVYFHNGGHTYSDVTYIDLCTNGKMWMEAAKLIVYPTRLEYTEGV